MNKTSHALLLLFSLTSCMMPLEGLTRRDSESGERRADPSSTAATAAPVRQGMMPRPMNHIDFNIGASFWDDLGGLNPAGVFPIPGRFGSFDRWGGAFDFGYDRVVWHEDRNALTVGVESGWSTFANNGSGISSGYSDISASLFYLAAAVRWRAEVTPRVTLWPGVGFGYYGLSIDEYDSYYYGWWWGYSSRNLYDDSTFGGFLSFAVDFSLNPIMAIRIDNKLHHAEFGGLRSLYPLESSVSGPIYTIEVGFVLGF